MMTPLKIRPLAAPGNAEFSPESLAVRLSKLLPDGRFVMAEKEPDILFFLTGGTERQAMEQCCHGRFYVLIGSRHHNAWASATEVKAWMNEQNIPSVLLDEEEAETVAYLKDFLQIKTALDQLQGKRLALLGKVSDWLIASDVSATVLNERFGIELVPLHWEEFGHYSSFDADESVFASFHIEHPERLTGTAKVSALLDHVIKSRKLDAITVECFPLVRQDKVTACLPLAKFNQEGIPSGCEGDLTAITGMMLCKELTGTIPWMANVNKVTEEQCVFSHCTIACGLVNEYSVKTHFETGEGTAIQGDFSHDTVTIFRFDRHLKKAFIATGRVTGRPRSETACRTQIEVKTGKREVELLRQFPLGNHHLIFPGDIRDLLQMTCTCCGIRVLGRD